MVSSFTLPQFFLLFYCFVFRGSLALSSLLRKVNNMATRVSRMSVQTNCPVTVVCHGWWFLLDLYKKETCFPPANVIYYPSKQEGDV